MANALYDAMQGMKFMDFGGQQVRTDDLYKQDLAGQAAKLSMSPEAYDKLLNPTTYGARWGGVSPTTASPSMPQLDAQPAAQPAAPQYTAYKSVAAPTHTPYKSAEFNFEADPGYAFRKAEGEKALQAKQLASGNFFSGGALKEATDFNSGLASQEYGNAFSRYLNKDAADYRNDQANFANDMSTWSGNDTSGYRNNQANFSNEFNRWKTLDDTNYNRALTADNTDYNRWTDAYNRDTNADNTNWSRLAYLDTSGQNATNAGNVAGSNMANSVSNLLLRQGDATAGGKIDGSNAWTNAIGNALYSLRK